MVLLLFFFNHPATTEIYTLSLHDALPILAIDPICGMTVDENTAPATAVHNGTTRSEEHTSELQSRFDLVCRLLLEKKKHLIPCYVTLLPFFLTSFSFFPNLTIFLVHVFIL